MRFYCGIGSPPYQKIPYESVVACGIWAKVVHDYFWFPLDRKLIVKSTKVCECADQLMLLI